MRVLFSIILLCLCSIVYSQRLSKLLPENELKSINLKNIKDKADYKGEKDNPLEIKKIIKGEPTKLFNGNTYPSGLYCFYYKNSEDTLKAIDIYISKKTVGIQQYYNNQNVKSFCVYYKGKRCFSYIKYNKDGSIQTHKRYNKRGNLQKDHSAYFIKKNTKNIYKDLKSKDSIIFYKYSAPEKISETLILYKDSTFYRKVFAPNCVYYERAKWFSENKAIKFIPDSITSIDSDVLYTKKHILVQDKIYYVDDSGINFDFYYILSSYTKSEEKDNSIELMSEKLKKAKKDSKKRKKKL